MISNKLGCILNNSPYSVYYICKETFFTYRKIIFNGKPKIIAVTILKMEICLFNAEMCSKNASEMTI